MKGIWISLLTLALLASCSSKKSYKKFNTAHRQNRIQSGFLNKVKPSESMQAGIPKSNSNYVFVENMDSDEDPLAVEENENLLNENGEYTGHFKVGNPYEVFGVSYFPQDYDDYEEIGMASWYGDDFHGKLTANGEIYNMEEMTAAHPTLPLPSMVRVTNLRNGKSVIVRVNDRGPFAKGRVLDVSEKAAEALGFKGSGTTEVKIELLKDDTDELLQRLKLSKN